MIKLDKSKLREAEGFVAKMHEIISVNCSCCQGMLSTEGYCYKCNGKGFVDIFRIENVGLEQSVDYWQARCLIAETKLEGYNT